MSELLERFASAVKANPTGIAVIEEDRQYTFEELEADANGIAATLLKCSKGDVVGILLSNCEKYVAALLGIWKAGKTAVPLNHLLSSADFLDVVGTSGADSLIATQSTMGAIENVKSDFWEMMEDPFAGTLILMADEPGFGVADFRLDTVPIDFRNPALCIYTSGMSGKPKCVELTHRNVEASVESLEAACDFGERGTFLCLLPFSLTFAIAGAILLPLFKGCRMAIADGFNPSDALALIRSHEIETVLAIPSMYAALAFAEGEAEVPTLRFAISTSEALPVAVSEAFEKRFGVQICEGFGQAEAGMVTLNVPGVPGAYKHGSAGKPLPGVEVAIWDDWKNAVPCGEPGEIMVRSESVRDRCRCSPSESERTITNGWLHTSDIGTVDADGFVTIIDRKEDLIVSTGGIVFPREIEGVIAAHHTVKEAAVFCVNDPIRGEVPKAYVIARDAAPADVDELLQLCVDKLARYKVPVSIEIVEFLPRTPLGQVWKRMLPAMDQRRRRGWRHGL